jgi:hypothetical protein
MAWVTAAGAVTRVVSRGRMELGGGRVLAFPAWRRP